MNIPITLHAYPFTPTLFNKYVAIESASAGFNPCEGIGGNAGSTLTGLRMNDTSPALFPLYFGRVAV
jgi:hypothetical protein